MSLKDLLELSSHKQKNWKNIWGEGDVQLHNVQTPSLPLGGMNTQQKVTAVIVIVFILWTMVLRISLIL